MQEEIFDIDLYNDEFFEWHLKYAREYSMVTMDWLLEFVPFKSVVDFGCGIGSYLESAFAQSSYPDLNLVDNLCKTLEISKEKINVILF